MNILFVCTGNTCRSAMAAALMLDIAVEKNLDVRIDSAGMLAAIGDPASSEAIEVMRRRGFDLSYHRSKPLTDELINMADVILTMTGAHKQLIKQCAPDKIYTILEYAGREGDIADPFGGGIEEYEETATQIYDALTEIAKKLPVIKE